MSVLPLVPPDLLDAGEAAVYDAVVGNGWTAGWPQPIAPRCRSLARVVLQAQRRHEAPATLPGVLALLDMAAGGLHALVLSVPMATRLAAPWPRVGHAKEVIHNLEAELRDALLDSLAAKGELT